MFLRYAALMVPQPTTPTRMGTVTGVPPERQANVLHGVRTARETNLETKLGSLLAAVEREHAPLDLTAHSVRGEPVTFAEAVRGDYRPFPVGEKWGPPWSTTWFHVRGQVPVDWTGKRVVAVFDIGFQGHTGFTCEALAWRDGKPWRGVDPNHRWLPVASSDVDFYLEASAIPTAVVAGPAIAPSMIALRESGDPAFVFRQAELQVQDQSARKQALDFKVLYELALALPEGDRRAQIFEFLNRFAHSNDPHDLEGALAARSTSAHRITAVGHAHIDTAWLWPLRETRRKCARTFSTALALMDEYPDYRFACSQPAQYAWMKESYPTIFEGIRQKVAAGQWEPVGSMWVEADCNLPSGEALVRQFVHGKRFFMQELGVDTRELWLPDVFGYPASLPQLIAESGGEYFLTQKLSWNDTNKPAHHTFMWEGIDGTAVFTHFPPADTYNGDFTAREIVRSVADFKDQARSSDSLYLYGWGDGGGGPEPDMIESAHRLRSIDGAPQVELGRAADFFARAKQEARNLTTWVGELYFELHRGTYTSQARTKRLNRRAEQALREAEIWSIAVDHDYPAAVFDSSWKRLLINQFHDILPGSSIDWVYEDAERELEAVVEIAGGITTSAQSSLAGSGDNLTVFNVNSHPRREVVGVDGRYILVDAPACGWASFTDSAATQVEPVSVSGQVMENGLLRVTWDDRGLLTSIWDKEARREALAPGALGNALLLHDDNPKNWDAWDVDADYRATFVPVTELASANVEVEGPLRAAVQFTRNFGSSKLQQRMLLDAGSRVLRFETEVDWQEEHKFLKVAFPVAVRSSRATYEIQFGHVERSTHANTSWDQARFEVCAHRWADLGEPGYGVALLNDCKYGYDIQGSVMRLSLLRAPTHPDPAADRGKHRFTYALMPHPGDFREAGVIAAAEDLNNPLRVVRGGLSAGERRSLIEVDTPQVVVEAIKRAEDSDAVIIRLYEAWGGRCRARVRTSLPGSRAFLCDLLERDRDEIEVRDGQLELDLTPFKILTLKLIV
ncbi:MAG: alpha-mannosidase [Chloroflexi bacterium]|nr:MAG: alpha-mannosidase [Chloroflexota bacterium]